MEIKTTTGPITVLEITGDIDAATFPRLVDEADNLLNAGHVKLVIDLHGVDYVSSGGLVALQTVFSRASIRKGKMVLCRVNRHVAQVLAITGFDKFIPIYPDASTAKANF